ncbi:1-acyl-sn-glycerol-3-phosphate acyltransferase [Endozoicomonas sp. Mp262]|uniref:lysophospholipid acyltransferase family protein n=1 Tax=Endozoicomonas sp. Mp262 TaxID=2919499 RepID=UPI0021D9C37B
MAFLSLPAQQAQPDGWLKRCWRTLATAFSFLVFGLGSLDLAFLIFPLILLLTPCGQKRRQFMQRVISVHFRAFLKMMQWLGIMKLRLENIELLTHEKGSLIIANHPTLIDVVVIMAYLPQVDCVVKEGLWHNPFLKGVVSAAGYISNSSDPAVLIQRCCASLEQGRNLIIFPEGTRTTPGKPPRFQRGVARVALQAKCPIRLIHLDCAPATLSKSHKWYQVPERPFVFSLHVGEQLDTEQWQQHHMVSAIGSRRLTRFLESQFNKETL